MIANCLTYEQLQAYSTHTMKKVERERLYMHISSCELCACAVNGFTVAPFDSSDLVAIHREIDSRVNATAASPLTLSQFFIVFISFLSIVGVYLVSNLESNNKESINRVTIPLALTINNEYHETQKSSQEEISSLAKTVKKIVNVVQFKNFDRKITPVEQLDLLQPLSAETVVPEGVVDEMTIAPHFNPNVIYIYDLKITDYSKLYFFHASSDNNLFKTHTPPSKENEKSAANDLGIEKQFIPVDRILKEGLAAFNKQQFGFAHEKFNQLLEYNPNDVNAKFYSALACYNMNRIEKAKLLLKDVMANQNDAFYPEAQWYAALLELKNGNKALAKEQLELIVSEKGFYSKRAEEKLKHL